MVLRMAQAGLGLGEIAGACGITTQMVHLHIKALRKTGELPEPPPRRTGDEVRAEVARLHREGLTQRAIGHRVGIGRTAVIYHIRKLREAGKLPDVEAS